MYYDKYKITPFLISRFSCIWQVTGQMVKFLVILCAVHAYKHLSPSYVIEDLVPVVRVSVMYNGISWQLLGLLDTEEVSFETLVAVYQFTRYSTLEDLHRITRCLLKRLGTVETKESWKGKAAETSKNFAVSGRKSFARAWLRLESDI